jgi:hypothetical protein
MKTVGSNPARERYMLWFENIFAEKSGEKNGVFTQNMLYVKNYHNVGFREKRIFVRRKFENIAENLKKSQKI